jgi:nitrite reductase/ring-hydroxylating ferredoxin subunit
MGQKTRVAHISEFSEENPLAVQVEGVDLVAVYHDEVVTLFEGRCPHQGTLLGEGTLEDGALVCRGHGWRFDPFGSGPRLCPGRSLALLEIKTAMAMVCRNFDLSRAGQAGEVGETFAFTMMPTDLFVSFSTRHPR